MCLSVDHGNQNLEVRRLKSVGNRTEKPQSVFTPRNGGNEDER